jgi:hypothetical protein
MPVCKITAIFNCEKAKSGGSAEETKNLPSCLYITVNSKVLLLWNINISYKLVNGTTGIVKDILFSENEHPTKDIPIYIIVIHFPAYKGPSFFQNYIRVDGSVEDRSKWYPLLPQTAQWYSNTDKRTFEKTSFPLSLFSVGLDNMERTRNNAYRTIMCISSWPGACTIYGYRMEFPRIPERMRTKIKNHKNLQYRIEEEKRLTLLADDILRRYNNNEF